MDLPKSYDASSVEERWREEWGEDDDLYAYDDDSDAPEYVIDTPPPYPTGNLHIGNALGWCYMDYAARYRRLQGYNVLFPQGWDCHGLPTEVKVEENNDVTKSEVPRAEFREMCVEHTYEMIDEMKETMETLGFSQDWNHEYVTMEPEYWGETQLSFVEMHDDGYAYRDHHPVNWCPRCETAIADAEVEREDRDGTLVYLEFPAADEDSEPIEIATTRPELLAACGAVAVEPGYEEWSDHVGDTVEVPLFGQTVEVIEDDEVDSEFGTGAVMICTFGDKQDVDWWLEYDLELREAFTREGTLTGLAGQYEGLGIDEAKDAITEDLRDEGYLYDEEPVEQSVGVCWRCDTPIEILAEEQWFIEVREDEVLSKAEEVDWIPDHALTRFREWTEGMEWDWVVSRQRVFATPFPVWYCDGCGAPYVADEDELPVDPTEEDPGGDCPECGGDSFIAEDDVMDTWMDSSITALYVGGWADDFRDGDDGFSPVQLREQGHDIIRTWAFYTVLRTAALKEDIPWEDALVNGMVFGDDGNKMSKSRGNFVQPEEVVEEYSADAFRQAMASAGRPGSDIQFQWKEVERASKFATKLWNIHRFAAPHVAKDVYEYDGDDRPGLRLADRWILSRLARVASEAEEDMDDYRFDTALQRVREFTWNELADDYLELVKGRLYEEDGEGHEAALWTLRTVIESVATMVSPFAPYLAEEVYDAYDDGSVARSSWPSLEVDAEAEEDGEALAEVVAAVRRWKSDEGMALNAELDRVEVYSAYDIDAEDASNALNAEVEARDGEPELERVPSGVDPDMSVLGPEFRDSAGEVVAALESRDAGEVAREKAEGVVHADVNGETVEVDGDAVGIVNELRSGGREVEVLEPGDATVLIFR